MCFGTTLVKGSVNLAFIPVRSLIHTHCTNIVFILYCLTPHYFCKIVAINYSNANCLYRPICLVTILRKILNLQVVTKEFSWTDPPSWKREILHVKFTTIIDNGDRSTTNITEVIDKLNHIKVTASHWES
jgi:hypothetical protein